MTTTAVKLPKLLLDLFAEFATDETLENEGVEMPYKSAKLIIARSGNHAYSTALSEVVNKHQMELDSKDEAARKLSDKLMIECIAAHILKGWSGMSYKGVELPYTLENAKMVLAHKDFRQQVMRMADDREAFKAKMEDAQAKN